MRHGKGLGMRATLIHSPRGGTASDDHVEHVRQQLAAHFELEIRAVEEGQSAQEIAREAVQAGSELLIASGGDGTVSAVAGAMVGNLNVCLGILPQGTANSIAGHLSIPDDLDAACAIICGQHERVVDTAEVNGRPMVLLATLGVHAEAVTEADPERKRKYGVLAYVIEGVSRLLDDSLFEVTLHSGDESFTCRASAVTIANLAPPTTLFAQGPASIVDDDGLLDVTLVAIEGVGDAIATSLHLAIHALVGLPANRENVAFFRAHSLRITTTEPKRLMVDGEDAGETPLVVRCVPRSLRVRVP